MTALYPNGEADISRDKVLQVHVEKLREKVTPGHKDLKIPRSYQYECPWPSAQVYIFQFQPIIHGIEQFTLHGKWPTGKINICREKMLMKEAEYLLLRKNNPLLPESETGELLNYTFCILYPYLYTQNINMYLTSV